MFKGTRFTFCATVLLSFVVSLWMTTLTVAAAPVEIRFAFWGSQAEIDVVKELKELFESKNPDIVVKLEHIPSDQYEQKLLVLAAAGNAPDVQIAREVSFLYLAKRGAYLDLTPHLKDAGYSLDQFYPNLLDMWRLDGKLYALLREFTPVVLYYNKDAFDRAGISYPEAGWTWEDFVKAAKRLTVDRDGDGKVDQWGTFMVPWDALYLPLVLQAGGNLVSQDGTKATLTRPETVEAFQFAYDLIHKYKVAPPLAEANSYGWINGFANQRFAMIFQGRWATPVYKDIKDFVWDVAPLPRHKNRATVLYTTGFAVSSQTKYPKQAARLAMFLASPEAQKVWGGPHALVVPGNRLIAESDDFITPNVPPANDRVFLTEAAQYGQLPPRVPSFAEFYQILNRKVNEIFLGLVPVEQGLADAEAEIDRMLERAYRQLGR